MGAALWAAVGYVGQEALEQVEAWRREQAAKITARRGSDVIVHATEVSSGSAAVAQQQAAIAAMAPSKEVSVEQAPSALEEEWTGFLTWLPLSLSSDASDGRRLKRLRTRLSEIEELLGADPASLVDPRIKGIREPEGKASPRSSAPLQ